MEAAGAPSPILHPPFPPRHQGVVETDLPCRKCGYNLRALSVDGRCPECGSAVGLSALGNLIRYSDPRWVRMLRRGARFIIYGIATIIIGAIIVVSTMMAAGFAGAAVLGLIVIGGWILILAGWWQLTEPDPSGIGEDEYGTPRQIIRIALVLVVINQLLSTLVSVAAFPPPARVAVEVVSFVLGIAGMVGTVAQLQYLGKLSLRIPDDKLAARARLLMFAVGACYALQLLVRFLTAVPGPGWATRWNGVLGSVGLLVSIAFLVFGIMYLLLIERLGKRFGEEASAAEQTWARAEAAASSTPTVGLP